MTPQVVYFPIRGRAEPIRLALEHLGIQYEEVTVDYAEMKKDLVKYPFGQCPRYVDEDGDLSQSTTIMRHLGRKHGLVGSSLADAARIDMLADGVEDLKRKYLSLIYSDNLAEAAKAAYWSAHLDLTTTGQRNGGAHFAYLAGLVASYGADWDVGSQVSIADILLFDIVDLHQRAFGEDKFQQTYPQLAAVKDRVAALPGVAAYLDSPRRLEKVNNNGLG